MSAHRIRNDDSAYHGLWCTCGATLCVHGPKPDPKIKTTTAAEAHWATLPHDVRQYWRARFRFDGPWDTVAMMAYEHAKAVTS